MTHEKEVKHLNKKIERLESDYKFIKMQNDVYAHRDNSTNAMVVSKRGVFILPESWIDQIKEKELQEQVQISKEREKANEPSS